MNRRTRSPQHSHSPAAVIVTCDDCGGQFTIDETTAYNADQSGDNLLCKPRKNGQPVSPSKALKDPEVDAIHEDPQCRDGVGPDAEPPVEARSTSRSSLMNS